MNKNQKVTIKQVLSQESKNLDVTVTKIDTYVDMITNNTAKKIKEHKVKYALSFILIVAVIICYFVLFK